MSSHEMHGHPGFQAAAESIAHRQGIPMEHAKAILAYGARHASKHAVHVNPHLLHVPRGHPAHASASHGK